ncbi:ATP-binding cassette domain-containing protein [Nodosilinea sp. LEGE 06152]|uniref:ATP-binding cassette domain-containing protein n=1 Tax=Nodosilinea sp. LEGE 06152 TaxID=2777966 RepID=UPI001881FB22|nr:ATP-binding cassette domain-containing protein [Nodosilinea sp. LEGE 06152]MBE9160424.1 ATP-binding cassette domain-containing protein [Nodosilinea sp. LEGE 06152]
MTYTQTSYPQTQFTTASGTHVWLNGVTKAFGDLTVLDNLSLEIFPGEFVAVVGKSGCGKSTLLRLLAGLETPTRGEIALDGQCLKGLNAKARVMFQDSRLLPWRKVIQNVALGLKEQARPRSHWALQQVGLDSRAKDWTTVLSGGQKQRVALARALVTQPHLLLLDEPLGALDALTRIDMQRLIETLWQEQQFTALLVTHDVEEAVMLSDRVIVVQNGRIDLDLPINLPRPRHVGSPGLTELKQQILRQILQN